MKNTKFRRRALISSIAMLLVALVALGSATFAWFAENPDAKTKSLTLKATASIGLVVQSATEKKLDSNWWTHEAVLNAASKSGSAMVASTDAIEVGACSLAMDGTYKGQLFTVPASAEDAPDADTGANKVVDATSGSYYSEKLYMKVTGSNSAAVSVTKVTFSGGASGSHLQDAVRVALTKPDGTVIGIWGPSGATAHKYLLKTGTYTATGVLSDSNYDLKESGTGYTLSAGTVGTAGTDYINVIAFLDGEDSSVYSTNIAAADLSKVMESLVIELHAAKV